MSTAGMAVWVFNRPFRERSRGMQAAALVQVLEQAIVLPRTEVAETILAVVALTR